MVVHLYLIVLVAIGPGFCDSKLQPYPVSNLKISSLSDPVGNALFGDEISITFTALQQNWDFDLKLVNVVPPDAEHIGKEFLPLRSHVYASPRGQFPYMSITVFDHDLIKGKLIKQDDDVYHIVPRQNYPEKSLISEISGKMIIYSDLSSLGSSHQRTLSQNTPFERFTDGDGCWVGQQDRRKMKIGIFADIGFRKRIDKLYNVEVGREDLYLQQVLQDYVAQLNEVYRAQFNIELELTALAREPASANLDFNQEPSLNVSKPNDPKNYSVCPDPKEQGPEPTPMITNTQLAYFQAWKMSKTDPLYWTLFTDCQPFQYDGAHRLATAYGKSLCSSVATSLVSFVPTDVGETWAAYAWAMGASFGGDPQGVNGLLNNNIGTVQYNGYYPPITNPDEISTKRTRMQYDLANKRTMCATIDAYVNERELDINNGAGPQKVNNCFEQTNEVFVWATTNCSKNPLVACTCFCNGVGQGTWTSRYICRNTVTQAEVEEENCIYPKPQGITEMCNFAAQNNGVNCPGIDPPATCTGGTPNNVLEEGELCDLGINAKCCSNCRPVTTGECVKFNKIRDAAFNLMSDDGSSEMNYVFQGRNFAVYTDIDTQKFGGPSPFLQSIRGNWKNLDPFFYQGIDAIIQNTDQEHSKYGFFYMFSKGKVTEYHINKGESFGWPKDIKNSIFSSVEFSTGAPNARNPIDAAMSYNKIVWFFQGIEVVKYTWGQVQQDDIYPLSMIQQFKLPREHFFNGASAVIYYHQQKQADFFSQSGVRIRWATGGTVGTATTNEALGVETQSNANTLKCPNFCTSCTDSIACEVCDIGYELVTGQCYERAYFYELFFDSDGITSTYKEDIVLIKKTSLLEENWGKLPAVNEKAVEFGKNGIDYITLANPGRSNMLKDYEVSIWVKFTSSRQSTLFTALADYGGRKLSIQVPTAKLDEETFTISFVYGGTVIPHPMKCKIGRFMHIIIAVIHEESSVAQPVKVASISIDGIIEKKNVIELDDSGNIISLGEFAQLKDMQIGAESNSFVGALDEFKIQNSNVPATRRYLNDSPHLNPSLCILLFVSAVLALN